MMRIAFALPPAIDARIAILEPCPEWDALPRLAEATNGLRRVSILSSSTSVGWPLEISVFATLDRYRVLGLIRVFDRMGAVVVDGLAAPADAWHVGLRAALESIEVRFEHSPPLAIREWWTR